MKLQGKTVIITGGGRDIGRACAMRMASSEASFTTGTNIDINGGLLFS